MRGTIKDRIYHKFEKEKQKLKIGGGSWTINRDEIYGKLIDKIIYETDIRIYEISMDEAISKGFGRILGGEHKLVVPIRCWKVTEKK